MPLAKNLLELSFLRDKAVVVDNFASVYLPALINTGINELFKLFVTKIGLLQKHTDFVGFQQHLFRVYVVQLVLNTLIVPVFSLSIDTSVWAVFTTFFQWQPYQGVFDVSKTARFFVTLFSQQATLAFLLRINRFGHMCQSCFRPKNVDKKYFERRVTSGLRSETSVYSYGRVLSQMITFVTVASALNLYIPLLLPLCGLTLTTWLFSEGIQMLCVRGPDLFSLGKIITTTLPWLFLGPSFSFLFTANKAYWNEHYHMFAINIAGLACTFLIGIGVSTRVNAWDPGNVYQIAKFLDNCKLDKVSAIDKADWLMFYSHPLLKQLPLFPRIIEEWRSSKNKKMTNTDLQRVDQPRGPKDEVDLKDITYLEDIHANKRCSSERLEHMMQTIDRANEFFPNPRDFYSNNSDGDQEEELEDLEHFFEAREMRDKHLKKGAVEVSEGIFRSKTLNPRHPRGRKPFELEPSDLAEAEPTSKANYQATAKQNYEQ